MNGHNQHITPTQTRHPGLIPCVWMQAGVVDYKLCDRAYDCDHCPFDEALHTRSKQQTFSRTRDDSKSISVQGCRIAPNLFYHREHTWARIEDGGMVRTGLDDFGQRILGRTYSVSLPESGATVQLGSPCLRLTHQTGVSALAAPVAGSVIEANSKLIQQPALMNHDPYGEGWLMLLEPVDLKDCLKRLMYGERVEDWLQYEIDRLCSLIKQSATGQPATLNDGGWLTAEFMSELTTAQRSRVIDSFFPLSSNEEAKSNNAIKLQIGR
jgi:glycine cleavage system H lipoate-binding protein